MTARAAVILGCSGPALTPGERALYRRVRPWGFVLFGRNVETPGQLAELTAALRETVDDPRAPVLVDQEGGRVQRLKPPHWPAYPPARIYGSLEGGLARRAEIAALGGRLMAHDLAAVGISVDCLPVLDVPRPGAHEVIGDRAFGETADEVATLGRAVAEGLLAGGVLPVIKHMPGHGLAATDSHEGLPVVDAALETLEAVDFAPFRRLADMPMAMSAHVVYTAIDPANPATTSETVIDRVIRGAIGFDGLLMTDDLSMRALEGDFTGRAERALAAGCDVVLHGDGDLGEMAAVAAGCRPLAGAALRRAEAALDRLGAPGPLDPALARARFDAALAGRWAA
ncbi:MAG: beta-N-acetylhexosaminidase [Pseudomonadota bacterium]